jgi:hypothetical protein
LPAAHRYVLPGEQWKWFRRDTAGFLVLGAGTFGAAYLITRTVQSQLMAMIVVRRRSHTGPHPALSLDRALSTGGDRIR